MFHSKCGSLIELSHGNRRATRLQPRQEFDNGLIFSAQPLSDNQLFEVSIDKKVS